LILGGVVEGIPKTLCCVVFFSGSGVLLGRLLKKFDVDGAAGVVLKILVFGALESMLKSLGAAGVVVGVVDGIEKGFDATEDASMSPSLVDGAETACLEVSLRADPKALPNPDPKGPWAAAVGFSSSSLAFGSALNELCSSKPLPSPERPVDCSRGGNTVSFDDDDPKAPPEPNGDADGFPKTLPPLGAPSSPPKPDFEAKLAKPPVDDGAAGVAVEVETLPKGLLAEGLSPPKPLVCPKAGAAAVAPAEPAEPHGEDPAPRPDARPKAEGWPNAGVAAGAALPNALEPNAVEPNAEPLVPAVVVVDGANALPQGDTLAPRAGAAPNAGDAEGPAPKADPPERAGAASARGGDAAVGAGNELDVDADGVIMPGYFVPVLIDSE